MRGGHSWSPAKTKYRVKNWAAYEKSLRQQGDITIWFDGAAVEAWNAPPCGRPGGQLKDSDVAIVTALTLRTVFHLPLRQRLKRMGDGEWHAHKHRTSNKRRRWRTPHLAIGATFERFTAEGPTIRARCRRP